MIRPLIIINPPLKNSLIVTSRANIDDKVTTSMVLLQITSHILNRISICFFDKTRCRKGHRNYLVCYVGQIEVLSFVTGCVLWTGHHLSHYAEH